jgi:hypothetical protein
MKARTQRRKLEKVVLLRRDLFALESVTRFGARSLAPLVISPESDTIPENCVLMSPQQCIVHHTIIAVWFNRSSGCLCRLNPSKTTV